MLGRPGGAVSRLPLHPIRGARGPWTAALASVLAAASFLLTPAAPAGAQDEFLINDDRVDRNQWAPRVARGSTGTLVVVWMDGRNMSGSEVDFDTYSMTLRNPQAVGSTVNRRVNDDPPSFSQNFPSIAASPSGTFFCAWEDGRAGNRDIYGATLDTLGLRITPNLRLNDDPGFSEQAAPHVTDMGPSQYLVVWGDQRQGAGEIFAARLTSSGAPIGPNIKISLDPVAAGSFQGAPTAASRADGTTLVAWLDGRAGGAIFGATFDVFAQLLDVNGQPLGPNFKINDTTGPQRNESVAIAADPLGGFVVAWIDRRSFPLDAGDVYAQRIDGAGGKIGPNVRVNDDLSVNREQRAVRALAVPGSAFLVWEDLRGNFGLDSNVEGAAVPYDASAPGINFRVNVLLPARQGTPGAIWDGRDAILGVWEDGRNGAPDVYAISFQPDGTRRGSETQLNDDAAAGDQWRPRVGRGPGRYIATWTDRRSGTDDLFAQWITAAGGRDGPNHRIWRADGATRAIDCDGAVAADGSALLVAHVARDSDAGEMRGFFYTTPGAAPASSFWITDSLPSAQSLPAVAANGDQFAVAWLDTREGAPRIYGINLGPGGAPLGPLHAVLSVEPADPVFALDLDLDPLGGYWLCYAEGATTDQRLWLVHLNAALVADRAPLPVDPVGGNKGHPSLGVGPDGRVEIVWIGAGANGLGQSYHQSFDPSGLPMGPALALGPGDGMEVQAAADIAVSGDRSVATWETRRDGNWSVWLQAFASGVAPSTGWIRVDQDVLGADQLDPSVGLDTAGRAVLIWADDRAPSSGSDIVGRVLAFAPTSVSEPPPSPSPEPPPPVEPRALRVGPATPNPFADRLEVALEVPPGSAERVTVRVVGVRGDVVATLHDGPVAQGRWIVRWDGRDARARAAASGVYWIVVERGGERRALRVVQLR